MAEGQGGERWAKAVRQIEGAARSGATRLDLSRLVDNCMVKNLTRNIMRRQLMHRTGIAKMVSFSIGLVLFTAAARISIGTPKHPKPIDVGMIALLASPAKYNGKVILTIGFLNIGSMHEDDNLWLHEEDGHFFLYKNSFALDLSDHQRKQFIHLNHTYVMITGTFRSYGPEGGKMNSGTIVHITEMDGWQPYRPSPPAKRN